MTDPMDEKIKQLYQSMEKDSPSEILDARIKKAARRQVGKSGYQLTMRWVSVAALLVLSVGVVLRVIQESPIDKPLEIQLEESAIEALPQADQDMPQQLPQKRQKAKVIEMEAAAPELTTPQSSLPASPRAVAPSLGGMAEFSDQADEAAPAVMSKQFMQERKLELKQSQPELFTKEQWCGQSDLEGIEDKQVWLKRLSELQAQDKLLQAECLKQFIAELFGES